MEFVIADDLIIFMPLTCDDDDVAFARQQDRTKYRVSPVGCDLILPSRLLNADLDLTNYFHRVLGPRIVRCDDRKIAVLTGNATHRDAFCLVAVSAAAKDCDYASGSQFTSSFQS